MAKRILFKGKTLDECVKAQPAGEVLYIGGAEAYFWIGTAEQYEAEIADVDQYMIDSIKNSIRKKKETIKTLKEQIKTLEKNAREWKPLRERIVNDCYPGIDPKEPGIKILINGRTVGRKYWFKHEYEDERRPHGKKEN